MSETQVVIRRLGDDDVEQYRDVRLESLQFEPEAFPTRYDEASAEELGYFQGLLRKNIVMGLFEDEELIGVAAYGKREDRPKMAHTGRIWGIYIKPKARGKGYGKQILSETLNHVPAGIERVYMSVIARESDPTDALYEKLGFETYGRRPKSLKDNDTYYDQVLMVKEL